MTKQVRGEKINKSVSPYTIIGKHHGDLLSQRVEIKVQKVSTKRKDTKKTKDKSRISKKGHRKVQKMAKGKSGEKKEMRQKIMEKKILQPEISKRILSKEKRKIQTPLKKRCKLVKISQQSDNAFRNGRKMSNMQLSQIHSSSRNSSLAQKRRQKTKSRGIYSLDANKRASKESFSSLSNMPSRKASRKTTIRGEKTIYEKSEIEGICNGCLWSSNVSCILWKYRKASLCVTIKKRLKQHNKSNPKSNPDLILRLPIKILSYWNPETREKEFSYRIVKKRLANLGWHTISSRKTDLAGYMRCIQSNEKKEQKIQRRLDKFLPPVNPWIIN